MIDQISIIEEGNKLIAEFMGYTTAYFDGNKIKVRLNSRESEWVSVNDHCIYHKSHDEIMKVLGKILKGEFTYRSENRKDGNFWVWIWGDENENPVVAEYANTSIKSFWLAVVEFIKWYNETKPVI